MLYAAGFSIFCIGTFWLGPLTDFFCVLITGYNLRPRWLYGVLSYTMIAPGIISMMYLGAELQGFREKKKILVYIYGIIGIIFEISIWAFNDLSFEYILTNPGDQIIDGSFRRGSVAYIIILAFLVSVLIFHAFGFLRKAQKSSGVIRRNFTFLSVGFFIFVICGALDSILPMTALIGLVRLVMATFAYWMYKGLKVPK